MELFSCYLASTLWRDEGPPMGTWHSTQVGVIFLLFPWQPQTHKWEDTKSKVEWPLPTRGNFMDVHISLKNCCDALG